MSMPRADVAAPAGLSEEEAAKRLRLDGPNALPKPRPIGWPGALAAQLKETVIVVLLAAAVLTAVVGDGPDTCVILAVVLLNSMLGAGQEVRTGRAMAALSELTAPTATVIRAGQAHSIDARGLVRGDLLLLAAGDIVAADAEIIDGHAVAVDESMLTGESHPAEKSDGETVFAGTVVTRGRAVVLVTAVAGATSLASIADAASSQAPLTPLQRSLASLGRRLALAVSVAAVVLAGLNIAAGRSIEMSLVLAISLAVAAIPESLPAVVSLSLALAARRMTRVGVLARRLTAVEALGSVTVLATDKTGTLTEGRMAVADLWSPPSPRTDDRELLEALVLCNDACTAPDLKPSPHDDPSEVALVESAVAAGLDVALVRESAPRLTEVPFDPARAQMSTTHQRGDGIVVTYCKGSPEAVLAELAESDAVREAIEVARVLATEGKRVLAVRRDAGQSVLLGIVALADPPRAAARETVAAFAAAGVKTVMITGDHRETARAIGRRVGIEAGQDIHARVTPLEKVAIVEQLRRHGEVVAMTGDGVNDAPALRGADIGVAMGLRGTEVAKQAADLILVNDDLAAMVPAIAEGRRAYDNVRRFLLYALAGGFAEVVIMLFGPLVGFAIPLQAGQILWVNLLTHGLPGVAMGNEPAEGDVLTRPPRGHGEALLDGPLARRIGLLGALITVVSLASARWAEHAHQPWQSSLFLTLIFAQLAVAVALRPRFTFAANPSLIAAVACNVGLALAALWWGPLARIMRLHSVSVGEIGRCLLMAVVVGIAALAVAVHDRQRRAHLEALTRN